MSDARGTIGRITKRLLVRWKRLVVLCAIAAGLLLAFIWSGNKESGGSFLRIPGNILNQDHANGDRADQNARNTEQRNTVKNTPSRGIGGRVAMMTPGYFRFNWKSVSGFLLKNPDKADVFCGVYALNPDPELKAQMMKFPDNPQVLATLATFEKSNEERLKFAEALVERDPENGFSHLLHAEALRKAGNIAEANEAFQKALESPNFDAHLASNNENQALAIKESGLGLIDRGLVSSTDPYREKLLGTLTLFLIGGGDGKSEDAKINQATAGLATIEKIRSTLGKSDSMSARVDIFSLEEMIIRSVPPDTEFGENQSVGGYLKQVAEKKNQAEKVRNDVLQTLNKSQEFVIREYFTRVLEQGDEPAAQWLLGVAPEKNQ